MNNDELITRLFRTEFRKIVSVLCYSLGVKYVELAEDIVSDTFLTATKEWAINGNPANPSAWLYAVAKNKAKNHLRRSSLYEHKIVPQLKEHINAVEDFDLDLSDKNISDSQLAMMFIVCDPALAKEAQIALALNLLCGFGVQEIADAFLTNRDKVYKRLQRAKSTLKQSGFEVVNPTAIHIRDRLDTVLTTIYLLFSEGYYSSTQPTTLRKELCVEAMRLNFMLVNTDITNTPSANALLSLMCFHSSRFGARCGEDGQSILYEDQDESLWSRELIRQGSFYLNKSSGGNSYTRLHLEAAIAYWHTRKEDTPEKWQNILDLYNRLLLLTDSPIAALNRTYALGKVLGKKAAIEEAEKLKLMSSPFYFSLLGNLYTGINEEKALDHYQKALILARSPADKEVMRRHIEQLQN